MAIDRRFLEGLRFVVSGIFNSKPTLKDYGCYYIVGDNPTGDFARFSTNSIIQPYYNVKKNWIDFNLVLSPVWGDVVFCEDNNSFMRFEGDDQGWKVIATCEDSSQGIPSFKVHTLTSDEVSAKSFSLSANINSGDENNVICLVQNVAQIVGTDFSASGNTIRWTGKDLEDIPLLEGDTFFILYTKSKS